MALLLFGCTEKVIEKHTKTTSDTLFINFQNKYQTFFPPSIKDKTSSQIITQLYLGLVKYNSKNLKIEQGIAKNWKKDTSGTVYTFHLNMNVYFNENPVFNNQSERVTMKDILFTFQYLCTRLPGNKNFFSLMYKIKGAQDYYHSHSEISDKFDIDGIKAVNDSTLQITTEDKDFPLLDVLALPFASIFSEKAYKKLKEDCYVGAGPYFLKQPPGKEEKTLLLTYNPYYFKQDKNGEYLPYMSNISISFIRSRNQEMAMLKKGELDIVFGLTNNELLRFLEQNIDDIESKHPKFIVSMPKGNNNISFQHIVSTRIKGFYSNSLSYIDLSVVYTANKE